MIQNLKKQLNDYIESLKNELKEQLEPLFTDFKLEVAISEDLEGVEVIAFGQTKPENGRIVTNVLSFKHVRSEKLSAVNTRSTINYIDQMGVVIATESANVSLTFDFIAFVFTTLINFIEEKNPLVEAE